MGFFMTFILYAGLTVLSDLLRPKPELENAKPAGLGDFRVPTATEQRPVPMIWGTVRMEGPNVVWYDDLLQEAILEKVKTGLFSSETITKGFRYHLGVQQALCMGPVDELTRIWIGEDLVYDGSSGGPDSAVVHNGTFTIDKSDLFGGEELGQGGVVGTMRFFGGTTTQAASTYLSGFQKEPPGSGDTPAYRGICFVAPDIEHVLYGTSTSIPGWKFELRRTPNGLGLTGGKEIVADGCNPANALYELVTDSEWGYGRAASEIDTTNFTTAATTLFDEGNGFSFILDRQEDISELRRRILEQIDGRLFKNQLTGKWQIKLTRNDYNILTVPEVNATNLLDLRDFTRVTWEGTTNEIRVPFEQSNDSYKPTYGFAQDSANIRIVGSRSITQVRHPGVKDATLANSLAWRELRTNAIPLAQGTFVVDRSLYGLQPGDVFAFTDTDLDFVKLPMRIKKIDYGNILEGEITIEAIQDVFFSSAGSFGDPPLTGWTPPSAGLVAYPTAEQLAFEAPRALTLRDPLTPDPVADKVYAAARRQGGDVTFLIMERNSAGTPTGDFSRAGQVFGFMAIGELQSALPISATQPVSSVVVVSTPDTQSKINSSFPNVLDLNELGTELVSLCLVDDEFILVQSSQTSGGNVQLNNVYRGVLDSVQADHSSGAKVYLLFVGAGISDDAVPAGNNVDVKLLPRSANDLLAELSATTIQFQMAHRTRRPYPPASFDLNNVTLDATNVDLDGSGSGEDVGILIDEIVRRDFRTIDEIGALGTDAASIFSDFPTANSTEVEIEIRNGVTVLHSETGLSGTSTTARQLDILAGLDTTSLPATLSIAVRESHTLLSTVYKSRDWFVLDFTVASPLVGKHAWGELDDAEISNVYDVQSGDDSTDHDFTLSSAFTVGDVEYDLNSSGTWLTLISAGGTTGSIPNASLSVGTDIRIRHLSSDVAPQKLLTMDVGGTEEAYAVMIS